MNRGRGALARSKSIDHQIDEERERRQKELQLLILGGASSGKSTFIKQLRIHHGDGFPEMERVKLRPHVYENVTDALNIILDNMEEMNLQIQSEELRIFSEELRKNYPKTYLWHPCYTSSSTSSGNIAAAGGAAAAIANADQVNGAAGGPPAPPSSPGTKERRPVTADFSKVKGMMPDILRLWADKGVQECYNNRSKYENRLVPAEEYFVQHLDRIGEPSYIPTVQDVLFIRKPTMGVQEHSFCTDGLSFKVIDVAGQKSQRKKWIHFFEGVTAVIFFAALSGFNEGLEEERSLNSLQDSIQTFSEVSHNSFLNKTDFILFLNKKDIFDRKLAMHKLSICFPSYTGENTPEACTKYVLDEFMRRKPENKLVFPHVSCAIDVDMMKKIIANVLQIIIEINLRKAAPF